jgi:hypothetical protein
MSEPITTIAELVKELKKDMKENVKFGKKALKELDYETFLEYRGYNNIIEYVLDLIAGKI